IRGRSPRRTYWRFTKRRCSPKPAGESSSLRGTPQARRLACGLGKNGFHEVSMSRSTSSRLLLVLLGILTVSPLFADWPLFRGNTAQTGVAKEALPDRLDIRWKMSVKRGIGSTAAIVDGVVYIGCYDEHLYALDLATGQQKWKFKGGSFKA